MTQRFYLSLFYVMLTGVIMTTLYFIAKKNPDAALLMMALGVLLTFIIGYKADRCDG